MKNTTRIFLFFIFITSFSYAQNIYTIAGGGVCSGDTAKPIGLCINGVALDKFCNVYITSICHNVIYRINTSGVLTIVAGNDTGTAGYSGDGGPATTARLNSPISVTLDTAGNLYMVDGNTRVRKVNTLGIISTIAGNGTAGYTGDGGPATAAELNNAVGLYADDSGNVLIADVYNNCVRKVNTSGIISTIAGTGVGGYSGDGGSAIIAHLNGPYGVTKDLSGNIYIADMGNYRIRKVNTSGIISTIVGNGTRGYNGDGIAATAAELNDPGSITIDATGNIYIGDRNNNRIRKVNITGIITTVAGNGTGGYNGDGGAATSSELFYPQGIALDTSGNIYIADATNYRLREVNTLGAINTIAGNGTPYYYGDGGYATACKFSESASVRVDVLGNIYISDDVDYNEIRKISTSGIISAFAGNPGASYSGEGVPATAAGLNTPRGSAIDDSGNFYITDADNMRVRKVNTSGIITTVAGNGTNSYSGDGGMATAAGLDFPTGVAVDASGNIYIADNLDNRIRKITASTGKISTIAGNGYGAPSGGGFTGDGGPATAAELHNPCDIVLDASGNIYIADGSNLRIREVTVSTGKISTFAGGGSGGLGDGGPATAAELAGPVGLTIDALGNIYIADGSGTRVRMVNTLGIINTVAGDGTKGYSGDGGAATSAELSTPSGIAVDASGNLYIADEGNNYIRKVSAVPLVVNELTNNIGVSVYPNPSTGKFMVQISNIYQIKGNSRIEIYNMIGEKIYSATALANQQIANNKIEINLSDKPLGIYMYRVVSEEGILIQSGKIMIQ
jgi:sugar lactone lactonase YvrE